MLEHAQEPLNVETIAEHPLLITIRSLDFIGSMAFSENMSFAVAYADSCRTEDGSLRGGSRLSGEGDVLLIKNKRLVWQKKIARPVQPRYLIYDKVFDLFRHFQRHPVLQPSIGRLNKNHVVLFDGPHKMAALLWTGRREFECKIYIEPDLRLLNEANIAAHDNFFANSIFCVRHGFPVGY